MSDNSVFILYMCSMIAVIILSAKAEANYELVCTEYKTVSIKVDDRPATTTICVKREAIRK